MTLRCCTWLGALAALLLVPMTAAAQTDGGVRLPLVDGSAEPLPPNVGAPSSTPVPIAQTAGTRTVAAGDFQIWVRGPLGERMVADVATARRADLTTCHRLERSVDGDGAPNARVMVRVVVARDGRVRDAIIYRGDATLRSDAAIRCVQNAMRQWRFPLRREESVIDYQFTLNASATDIAARRGVAPEPPTGTPAMSAGAARIAAVDPDDTTEAPMRNASGNLTMQAQARIAVTEGEVQGGLFGEDAHRVVRGRQGEVRACYEAAVRESPEISGRLTLALIVAPNGSVARATVQGSTVGNERVERCIIDAARRWRFPPARTGDSTSLRYPVTLSASAR